MLLRHREDRGDLFRVSEQAEEFLGRKGETNIASQPGFANRVLIYNNNYGLGI